MPPRSGRPRRRLPPQESPRYKDVMASLWAHRKRHGWEPGMVWDPYAGNPAVKCEWKGEDGTPLGCGGKHGGAYVRA